MKTFYSRKITEATLNNLGVNEGKEQKSDI